jgi:DNA processing protein
VISSKAINTLKLRCIKGMTDAALYKIYEMNGRLSDAFDLDMGAFLHMGLKKSLAENILTEDFDERLFDKEMDASEEKDAVILSIDDELYPEMLKETKGAPPILYARGTLDALNKPAIAMVGSRGASRASKDFARRMAADLAEVGFNVVSGFALGIDIYAHMGAVTKGLTTAVMGCGINNFYPPHNEKYLNKVLENGCVLTEFVSDMAPLGQNFPQRNRIISGMSLGVVVVEASKKSGSLITARLAGEQGREVFAVPAFPDTKNSATNSLIKDGARLVENYYDIVDELKYHIGNIKEVDKDETSVLEFGSPEQAKLFNLLETDTLNPDELSAVSGLDTKSVAVHLAQMELEGYVIREIDGKYRAAGGLNGQNSHSSQFSH